MHTLTLFSKLSYGGDGPGAAATRFPSPGKGINNSRGWEPAAGRSTRGRTGGPYSFLLFILWYTLQLDSEGVESSVFGAGETSLIN